MRIVLIGQAAFAAEVFKKLREREQEIVGVFCPPDSPKGKLDPLKDAAQAAGVPVFQPGRLKDPEAAKQMQSLNADLGILAFVTDIVPPQVFKQPRFGSICYHPSLLPLHRGASAINWAVIYGDTKTGVTVFWVDEGIDTGDILLQKEVEIGPDETTGALYFNKLYPLGVEALVDAVELIEAGSAPRLPQEHSHATYEPPCDEKVSGLDWNWPGRALYDFIRGCDPQPGATTTFRGESVKFYNTTFAAGCHSLTPGEILEVSPTGLKVAARGGILQVSRFRTQDLGKVTAEEFSNAKQPQVGEKFGA